VVKRFSVLLASMTLLITACGGTNTDATSDDGETTGTQAQQESTSTTTTTTAESSGDETGPGDDGVWDLSDFMPGGNFDENTDYRAIEMEAQQKIATCMAAEGFEYIPFVPSDIGGGMVFDESDQEEYVKTYGFGVSTWVLQDQAMNEGDFEDPNANDPNNAIVEAMDEFESDEYYRVLYGGEPDIIVNTPPEELEAMTEEELMAFYDEAYANWQPDGCQNQAYEDLYGGEADMGFYEEFGEDLDAMYQLVDSDDRIVSAQAEWSSCMAAKGYDFADQDEMYAYFYGTDANGQWVEGDFSQRVNAVVTWPDYEMPEDGGEGVSVGVATTIMVEGGGGGEYVGPEYDMEQLQPLIDEEIATATANYECSQPLYDLYEEIYQEYQQRFVDENLDRLIAFRDENG
jgi:hypothetical protein